MKTRNGDHKCGSCGQTVRKPQMGTVIQNVFRKSLGVVLADDKQTTQYNQVRVAIITGASAGEVTNWYTRNVEKVNGHVHIASRTAL